MIFFIMYKKPRKFYVPGLTKFNLAEMKMKRALLALCKTKPIKGKVSSNIIGYKPKLNWPLLSSIERSFMLGLVSCNNFGILLKS